MPTLTTSEQRFAAALGALALAGERAESSHFGGMYLGDAPQLALAVQLRDVRRRFLEDWAHARNDGDRAKLADVATYMAEQFTGGGAGRHNAAGLRNAWVWSPQAIADAIAETDAAVVALSRDIFQQFCRPFELAQQRAEAEFARKHGRAPSAGPSSDWTEIYRSMGVEPDSPEAENKCYQGQLVRQYRAFVADWNHFKGQHRHWHDNMWGATGDQAVAYRQTVNGWRQRFADAGGKPSTPAPQIPTLGVGIPWAEMTTLAALVAAALVVPAMFNALSSRR